MSVQLAPGVSLPADIATRRTAIIARSGGGKTYTAAVLAEEMVREGIPWYALDPMGAWWGLRADADGRKAGLPVIVIGGEHGDVPLPPDGGAAIADLVAHEPSFYVIDMSELGSRGAEVRFSTAFLERLFRTKARRRDPLHGFWDEADMYAPQRSGPDEARMLGAAEHVMRRGRIRGLGTTLITQRPAVVNKNVLSQIDVLIALRIGAPQDRRAIKDWLDGTPDPARTAEVLGSLASLGLGEAWLYGPGELPPLYQRVRVRQRSTFNSSAAGKADGGEPARLADVDLEALRERLAAVVERAKADDPKALRARVAELERELRSRPAAEPERVEVPVLASGNTIETVLLPVVERMPIVLAELRDEIARLTVAFAPTNGARNTATSRQVAPPPPRRQAIVSTSDDADLVLNKAERSILAVLAQYPQGRTTTQIAILTGYSSKGGGFRNALGSLRTRGFISPARIEPIIAYAEGVAAAGDIDPLPTGRALFDQWLTRLNKAEREVLEVLYGAYPGALTAEQIAESTESQYAPSGGGFRNALGKLRTLELAEGHGEIRASEVLFS